MKHKHSANNEIRPPQDPFSSPWSVYLNIGVISVVYWRGRGEEGERREKKARRTFLQQEQCRESPVLCFGSFQCPLGQGGNISSKSHELKVALSTSVLHCQGFPTGISMSGNKPGDGSLPQVWREPSETSWHLQHMLFWPSNINLQECIAQVTLGLFL